MGQAIRVTVQPIEDIGKIGPTLHALKNPRPLKITDVCIMEGGTQQGKASVFMVFESLDGKNQFHAEITENNFNFLAGMFKGAIDRFTDLREQRAKKN